MAAKSAFLSLAIHFVLFVTFAMAVEVPNSKMDYEFWKDSATKALAAEEYDEAITAADKAICLRPVAEMYDVRASAYAEKKDFLNAIVDCDTALQKDPDRATLVSIYFTRAQCYLELRDYRKAISAADSASKVDQNNLSILITRATAELRLKRFDSALNDCNRLVRLSPKDADYYGMRRAV